MFNFKTDDWVNLIISWPGHFLLLFKTLGFTNRAFVLWLLFYFVVPYSCYIFRNKVCSLRTPEHICFSITSHINIISADSRMVLETWSRFGSCNCKFRSGRLWSYFIIGWSWKLSNLVMFFVFLHIKRCRECIFKVDLLSHILNRFKKYIGRSWLLLNFKNFSFWFRYYKFLITPPYCLTVYLVFQKCFSSFTFILETTFQFGWHRFPQFSLNAIIETWYFQVCISCINREIREG